MADTGTSHYNPNQVRLAQAAGCSAAIWMGNLSSCLSRRTQDALQVRKQHLGTHPVHARLLGRSWHARAIAARLCSPAWPLIFGGETPGSANDHPAYIATPGSPG